MESLPWTMVLISEGNSEMGALVWNKIANLICLWLLLFGIISTRVANVDFYLNYHLILNTLNRVLSAFVSLRQSHDNYFAKTLARNYIIPPRTWSVKYKVGQQTNIAHEYYIWEEIVNIVDEFSLLPI